MPKTERVLRRYSKLLPFIGALFCSFFFSSDLISQCAIACNNQLQISVNNQCEIDFTPDILLEGNPDDMAAPFALTIAELGIVKENLNYTSVIPSGTYKFEVSNNCGNSCWGDIIVEDNINPTIANYPCGLEAAAVDIKGSIVIKKGTTVTTLRVPYINNDCQPSLTFGNRDPQNVQYYCPNGDDGILGTADDGWCNAISQVLYVELPFDGEILINARLFKSDGITPFTLDEDITLEYSIYAPVCLDNPCKLTCLEIDSMLNDTSYMPDLNPVFNKNCMGNLEVDFEDQLIKSQDGCDPDTIIRKYSTLLNSHGTSRYMVIATQYFLFEPIDLDAIEFPDSPIEVSCEVGDTPEEIANYFDDPWTPVNEGVMFAYPYTGSGLGAIDASSGSGVGVGVGPSITYEKCIPSEVHIARLKEKKEDIPFLYTDPRTGETSWILIDQWIKEFEDKTICGCSQWDSLVSLVVSPNANIGDVVSIDGFPAGGVLNADGTCKSWPSDTKTEIVLIPIKDDKKSCNIGSNYSDVKIPICGTPGDESSYKIIRTWTLYNWCDATSKQVVQIIKVLDETGPEFVVADSLSLSTDPWLCGVNFEVPPPDSLFDKCSVDDLPYSVLIDGHPTLAITGDYKNGFTILDIPAGDQKLIYTVSDNCGNSTKDTTLLWIKDNVPPVAIAKENIVVSLTSSGNNAGYAKVYYNSIDNGSHDICSSDVKIEIRREKDGCNILGNDTYTSGRNLGDINFGLHPDSTGVVDPDDGNYIKFCCSDLTEGTFGIHRVWMRVWDDANKDGIYGNEGDNYNEVWANVRVEDKLNVIINCPSDRTVDCSIGLDSLSVLGEPNVIAACDGQLSYVDDILEGHCPTGEVIRKWFADKDMDGRADAGEKFCKQVITITDPRPMFCSDVVFPKDTIVDCASADMNSTPIWPEDRCGLFGFSEKVEIFELQDEYCYKIVKQFTVIDWCQYNPNNGSDVGICYGSQKITVTDSQEPTFASCEDKIVESADGDCVVSNLSISQTASDEGDCLDKELIWTVCLDLGGNRSCDYTYNAITQSGEELLINLLDDDGNPITMIAGTHKVTWTVTDACDNSASCTTDLIIADKKAPTPICIEAISTSVMSSNGTAEIWATDFDPDKKSFDNCDKSLTYSFSGEEIIPNLMISCGPTSDNINCGDCKQIVEFPLDTPIPGEVNKLVVGGEVLDLEYPYNLNDPFDQQRLLDDCIALGFDVTGRINQTNETLEVTVNYAGVTFESVSIDNGDSYSFTCVECRGSVENGLYLENGQSQTFEIPMWVWDDGYDADHNGRITADERNKDWCMVMLRVDDNVGACTDTEDTSAALISGDIHTDEGEMVENVEVMIESSHPEYPSMAITPNTGVYAFSNNPMQADYEISATRDDNYMNGVSTLDLVLIQQHILGLNLLNSPYKIIASDINNDSRISASDLVELRKLILGVYDALPANSSWRFVEEAQLFQDPTFPFPFAENIEIYSLSNDMSSQDFVGVKIGDVNGNVTANSLKTSQVRTNRTVELAIEEQQVAKAEQVQIDFTSEDFKDVFGMQFTMSHAGLRLANVIEGAMDLKDENVAVLKEGAILSLSWNTINPISSEGVLFSLVFDAVENVDLSSVISINSQVTQAEAYTSEDYVLNDVRVKFNTPSVGPVFALYQNEPNPFSNNTSIGFNLPEASSVTLKIFDVTGKLVLIQKEDYPKGLSTIELNRDDLSSSGILYYQIDAGKHSATKKMVLIK